MKSDVLSILIIILVSFFLLGVSGCENTINTTSTAKLSENPEDFLNKTVTIIGFGIEKIPCYYHCEERCNYGYELEEEKKETIPSSKHSVDLVFPTESPIGTTFMNKVWKCNGQLKKDIDEFRTCYYFEASYCECISSFC